MAGDDDRRELFDLLEPSLGSRGAALLMAQLPPVGWADLATKTDLGVLRSEVGALRSELVGEMAKVGARVENVRAELKGDIAEVKGDLARLEGKVAALVPKLWAANIASMFGVAGLVLTIAAFFH